MSFLDQEKANFEEAKARNLELRIKAWEKLTDMSMHMNDLCLNIRRFALATLGALLGAAGLAYRFAGTVELPSSHYASPLLLILATLLMAVLPLFLFHSYFRGAPGKLGFFILLAIAVGYLLTSIHEIRVFPIASLFIGVAAVIWILCFLMDRYWYHELLRGVLVQTDLIEQSIGKTIPAIRVTARIREFSHAALDQKARTKLSVFYSVVYVLLVLAFVFLLLGKPSDSASAPARSASAPRVALLEFAPLPKFLPGSANLTSSQKTAVCDTRNELAASHSLVAIVVGRHDQTQLTPETRRDFHSNEGLPHPPPPRFYHPL